MEGRGEAWGGSLELGMLGGRRIIHPPYEVHLPTPTPQGQVKPANHPLCTEPGKAVISQLTSMLMKIISTSWGLRNRCKGFIKCCGGVGREGWRRGRFLLPGKPQRHREEETEMERDK